MRKALVFLLSLTIVISTAFVGTVSAEGTALHPASVIRSDGEKWGFIDNSGSIVIKPEYDFVRDFNSKGIAIAIKGGQAYNEGSVVFIDRTGKTVAGPINSNAPDFVNGVAILTAKDYGSKVFDEFGKLLFQSSFAIYEYSDGLFRYSTKTSADKELYGYLDITGKPVIPAKYMYAGSFRDGMASVTLSDGTYAIIDKTGKTLQVSKQYIGYYGKSEGLSIYRDAATNMYGYRSDAGKSVIKAAFSYAGDFSDGVAIVAVDVEYRTNYGIIDKNGNYIMKPEYSGITSLGEGLFAVSHNIDYYSDQFAPKAIYDNKGNKLTDYLYYTVNPFKDGYASACDDTSTFFIDKTGKKASNLTAFDGIGTMTMTDGIVKAEIDGGLQYVRADGSLIWKKDETIPLDGGISIKNMKYRRDFCTFIKYPEIQGMKDSNIQKTVNSTLKTMFTGSLQESRGEDGFAEDIYVSFSVEKNKDLLILEESGYYYPIGAAHGQPTMVYHYIDLKSGVFYKLEDLFKSGSSFYDRLTSQVQKQIELNLKTNKIVDNFYYFDEKPTVAKGRNFIIGRDSISIYFDPYEISAYAAGFPQFAIPYGQLTDCINTGGAFWNSFDKVIVSSKVNFSYDVDEKAGNAILKTVKAYETGIIDAINTNSFSKVEDTLVKGSTLYNSQTQLVKNLYKKGVKEKLVRYEVYMVAYDYGKKVYKVFTFDDVAVKNPGGNYVTNRYNWCYTAVYDEKIGTARLSSIEKW